MTGYSKDISPVGWYVGSYVLRFVELNDSGNSDPDRKFLVWENTVIVRAGSLDEVSQGGCGGGSGDRPI